VHIYFLTYLLTYYFSYNAVTRVAGYSR